MYGRMFQGDYQAIHKVYRSRIRLYKVLLLLNQAYSQTLSLGDYKWQVNWKISIT
jgi:hypothetical protein